MLGLTTARGATVLVDSQYSRDALGRITAIAGLTPADSWSYGYDSLDRLTSADNLGDKSLDETFVHAANDNSVSRSRVAVTYVCLSLETIAAMSNDPLISLPAAAS